MTVDNLTVAICLKKIKNINLSVNPPNGYVKVSAPYAMKKDMIRVFIVSKLNWIRKKQQKFVGHEGEEAVEFIERKNHYYLGRRCLLLIIEDKKALGVILKKNVIEVRASPGYSSDKIELMVEKWYRNELNKQVEKMIDSYEAVMEIKIASFTVKKMKTLWGSYHSRKNKIVINLDLIKKPVHLLEYIVVHEMVHYFERKHNARFAAYMDKYLPAWRDCRKELNKLPIGVV